MKAVVVHVSQQNANKYGGDVIRRVVAFNSKNGLKAEPENIFAELSTQMYMTDPNTLCLACVDDDDCVRGHAVIHAQDMYGYRTAMIYHLAIDDDARDETRVEMLDQGWVLIEDWARLIGCKAIRAWAMNKQLSKIFSKYGLKPKEYVFMEKILD